MRHTDFKTSENTTRNYHRQSEILGKRDTGYSFQDVDCGLGITGIRTQTRGCPKINPGGDSSSMAIGRQKSRTKEKVAPICSLCWNTNGLFHQRLFSLEPSYIYSLSRPWRVERASPWRVTKNELMIGFLFWTNLYICNFKDFSFSGKQKTGKARNFRGILSNFFTWVNSRKYPGIPVPGNPGNKPYMR